MVVQHGCEPRYHTDWAGLTTVNVRDSINRWVALTGKALYVYSAWLAEWGGDFGWFMRAGDHSVLPLLQDDIVKAVAITWRPWATSVNDQQTMKDIIAGYHDAYIKVQADHCIAFGYPIYMRFGAEMNINQGKPSDGGSWAANSTDFVNCWKHVVDLFRARGASNVIWVWNPNFQANSWVLSDTTKFYPGDGYVDWVGIDMYQADDSITPETEITPLYNEYGARKPISINEWGVNSYPWTGMNTPDATQALYMSRFFDAVEARPNVKMIAYWYVWDSMKFDNQPLTLATYRSRISNPLYIGGESVVTLSYNSIPLPVSAKIDGTTVPPSSVMPLAQGSTVGIQVPALVDDTLPLSITSSAGSNGIVSPLGIVPVARGSSVTFVIAPDSGYQVSQVVVDGASVGAVTSYTFTNVQSDHSISASFTLSPVGGYILERHIVGSGSIVANPEKTSYSQGEPVELTAVPDVGWVFAGWTWAWEGMENPIILYMNENPKIIYATFTEGGGGMVLTLVAEGNGIILANPSKASYSTGEMVELTAVPGPGYAFAYWTWGLEGSLNPDYVWMNEDKEVHAIFTPV